MPISLCSAAVVLSPNGLMLLGGQEWLKRNNSKTQNNDILNLRNSDLMLEVVMNSNESMEWRILLQKLDRPRNQPIALLIPDELTYCSNSSTFQNKENNGKMTKSGTMLISTKLVSFLLIIWGGTISLQAFIFCKGLLINNSEPDENPFIITENLPVALHPSDSHIHNFSLVENTEYETLSSIMEICIIPSSQIKLKTEIGTYLSEFYLNHSCILFKK